MSDTAPLIVFELKFEKGQGEICQNLLTRQLHCVDISKRTISATITFSGEECIRSPFRVERVASSTTEIAQKPDDQVNYSLGHLGLVLLKTKKGKEKR